MKLFLVVVLLLVIFSSSLGVRALELCWGEGQYRDDCYDPDNDDLFRQRISRICAADEKCMMREAIQPLYMLLIEVMDNKLKEVLTLQEEMETHRKMFTMSVKEMTDNKLKELLTLQEELETKRKMFMSVREEVNMLLKKHSMEGGCFTPGHPEYGTKRCYPVVEFD
jgi:hypothetical protein